MGPPEVTAQAENASGRALPAFGRDGYVAERHDNNVGVLRLAFACAVILSHSSELIDGDRSREILTRICGTLSFGEFGVDGFFLVSGYLVTKSYENSAGLRDYLIKRMLRVYPGYLVAFLACILIVGPLAGGNFSAPFVWQFQIFRMMALAPPELPGCFVGLHYPLLNGSMWTVAYEFRCYLLLTLAQRLRLSGKGYVIAFLILATLYIADLRPKIPYPIEYMFGNPRDGSRFLLLFLVGSWFYLHRNRMRYNAPCAVAAVALLILCMLWRESAEIGLAVFGGYIIFYIAFGTSKNYLSRLTARVDISYGVYLYAWPVQNLFVQHTVGMSPSLLFIATLLIAGTLGYLSWSVVERPFLSLKARLANTRHVPTPERA